MAKKKLNLYLFIKKGNLVNIKQIDSSIPLTSKQKNEAIKFIQKFHLKITSKWYDFFVLNKKIKCHKIKKKI